MYRDRALAQARWERKNVVKVLDSKGCSQPNPDYVKKELISGVVVETMPNVPKEVEEKQ